MSTPKLITVFGATGLQGGSVVQSLLANKNRDFSVRGITRNPVSENSKALVARGVEMVKADGANLDEVRAAFRGSWAVFLNTNSEDPNLNQPGGPSESDFGKALVDIAAEVGVQHLVYSGMHSASEVTNGTVPVRTYDGKNAVGEYAKTKGFKSAVVVAAGWYMENHVIEEIAALFGGFPYVTDEEGYLTLHLPRWGESEEVAFVGIQDDLGDIVHGVFLDPEAYNGQRIQAFSQSASLQQLVDSFQQVTGKKSRYVVIEDWRSIEVNGNLEVDTLKGIFGMTQYTGGKYYSAANDLGLSKALKAKASVAQGLAPETNTLVTLEEFWRKRFA